MKNRLTFAALALLALSTLNPQPSTVFAQGTAFTYQGRLNDGASPANGSYDLTFTLFNALSGPSKIGTSFTNTATAVSNGLFTVTLDFGANFPGADRWLEIGLQTNGGGGFTTLSPRQKLTPAPYAVTAENVVPGAGLSGTYSSAITLSNAANQFMGSYTGNGANVTNVNAAKLGGLPLSSFWQTSGNGGTVPGANVLGTTDNQPLELWVNGTRALKIIPTTNTANWIGGTIGNVFDPGVVGATIAGGGGTYQGFFRINYVRGSFGSIGGGIGNTASNLFSTVSGGFRNNASGIGAFVGGGGYDSNQYNYIPNLVGNSAPGTAATIGGGIGNMASGSYAVVGGGFSNTASGYGSFVGGGGINGVNLVLGTNFYGNIASGISATVGGGVGNFATDDYATVAGGDHNAANNQWATVCGGKDNVASGYGSFVGGGGVVSGISGGNIASGDAATVCGGIYNVAAGNHSFAAGWGASALHAGSFVWSDGSGVVTSTGNSQFLVNAGGGVGIGLNNPAAQLHVASASGNPQVQITQNNSSDYTRLRMNVAGSPSWEMDVSSGVAPSISWWTGVLRMNLDYNGNLTTSGTVNGLSDRNAKEKFTAVSSRAVLDKVATLPISEWNFKNESSIRHIGPMAQDFYTAFSVGMDDKHIATVDEGGVALAAIQGLNQKLDEKDSEIQTLKQQNKTLENRLENLEHVVESLTESN